MRNRLRPFWRVVALWMSWLAMVVHSPAEPEQNPDRGPTLFAENCAACHGAFAEGGSAPDLTNVFWQSEISDTDLDGIIRSGIAGSAMPGFGEKLDQAARQLLVQHIRSLAKESMQPTTDQKAPVIRVSTQRLLKAGQELDEWLMYGRDYGNQRFSPLDQITKENVKNLVPAWSFQTGVPDGLQATPLFVNGVIFLSTSWNHAFAIDAHTGAELWHYKRRLPEKLKLCCGPVNRGLAILDDTVYMATLDAHLVALDALNGRVRWDVEIGKVEDNLSSTSPPLIVGNKVVVGVGGGDFPSRGFIDAYDSGSGRRLWRFYTIPDKDDRQVATWSGDSHKTGGGATWLVGSYDPDLNLIYWGVGNPYPDYDGDPRQGDNLYTNSVVALDADSGKLKWNYQFTPHDVWDYDGVNEMVLVDLNFEGRQVKALLHADRNGHFYAVDRTNGRLIYAEPFVRVSWAKGFDPSGRPIVDPKSIPNIEGVEVCPGAAGGKEWNAMAYSPLTRMIYIPVIENCALFKNHGVEAKRLGLPPGESGFRYLPNQAFGKVLAVHAVSGKVAWQVRTRTPMAGGMLATAGGLVFTGDPEGNFLAYDSEDGRLLWSYQTGSGIRAAPISYRLNGKQYVAILSGMGGAVGGFTGAGAPWMRNYRTGDTLYVFQLFEPNGSTPFHGGARR